MAHKNQPSTNMVDALSNILKHVRLFGHGSEPIDVEETLAPVEVVPQLTVKPSVKTAQMSKISPCQAILYQNMNRMDSLKSNYSSSMTSSMGSYSSVCSSLKSDSWSSSQDTDSLYKSQDEYDYPSFADEQQICSSYQEDLCDDHDLYREDNNNIFGDDVNDLAIQSSESSSLAEISLAEVSQHDMMHDCWIVLYDKVNVTDSELVYELVAEMSMLGVECYFDIVVS